MDRPLFPGSNIPPKTSMTMETGENRSFDWCWLLFWGIVSSIWCAGAARELGPTFDEPFYMQAGMERWRTGSYHGLLRAGTMPLPIDVETLPVYLYERWMGVEFDTNADLHVFLPYARLGMLAFWWLLLIYARLIARSLAGPWAGRLAVALIAVEPSFLGNACLATTDMAITACMLPAAYHFARNRTESWGWRIGLPALWFGIALAAKASALVFVPVCWLVIECRRLQERGELFGAVTGGWARLRHAWTALRPFRRDAWRTGWLALAVVFVYCGCDWRSEPSFVRWAEGLEDGVFKSMMVWMAENLRLFPNAGSALVRQIRHNVQGHTVYLVGLDHHRWLWFYFPLLVLIKLSLPLLGLTFGLAATRPRLLANWAFLCFLTLMILSLGFRVQIGIRMILPCIALGICGLSAALVQVCRDPGIAWGRPVFGMGVLAGLLWTATGSVLVWPHGLCYANPLWGGPRDAYVHVSDANFDWGQGLPDLVRWQQRHQAQPLAVWYFGTDPQLEKVPMRRLMLHLEKMNGPDDFRRLVRGSYVAVATTNLYGGYSPYADIPLQVLRPMRPVARTQTFLIYDFTSPEDSLAGVDAAR